MKCGDCPYFKVRQYVDNDYSVKEKYHCLILHTDDVYPNMTCIKELGNNSVQVTYEDVLQMVYDACKKVFKINTVSSTTTLGLDDVLKAATDIYMVKMKGGMIE